MKTILFKIPGWMNNKMKSSFLGLNFNNLRCADGNNVKRESEEELKRVLMRIDEESRNIAENSTFKRPET